MKTIDSSEATIIVHFIGDRAIAKYLMMLCLVIYVTIVGVIIWHNKTDA